MNFLTNPIFKTLDFMKSLREKERVEVDKS